MRTIWNYMKNSLIFRVLHGISDMNSVLEGKRIEIKVKWSEVILV